LLAWIPAPLDFHGEAARFVGKIEIVGSYVELTRQANSDPHQRLVDSAFVRGSVDPMVLDELRPSQERQLLRSFVVEAGGRPRSRHMLDALSTRFPYPPQATGVAYGSDSDAVAAQEAGKGAAAYACFLGSLLARGAGEIQVDPVVSIRRFPWRGHVYDLHSVTGWQFNNSILCSNCACYTRQLTKDEAEELGVDEAPDSETVEWENDDGETAQLPAGVMPGFGSNRVDARERVLKAQGE
jgi:hypothetical protein